MENIRPISDLRNHFAEISRIVHEENMPVFLTKNGHGDMVVMSMKDYNEKNFQHYIDLKLIEAEIENQNDPTRYDLDELLSDAENKVREARMRQGGASV